jgi:FtsP/CotA-like multicopper oxidase with cupredoxin domain
MSVSTAITQGRSRRVCLVTRLYRAQIFLAAAVIILLGNNAIAQPLDQGCSREPPGSLIPAPTEIHSQNGVLRVSLSLRSSLGPAGDRRYCYIDEHGNQSPTLRLKPGDLLVLTLTNELTIPRLDSYRMTIHSPCASPSMQPGATNLHFHGLTIAPVCHADDVLHTTVAPGAEPYEYRVRIPPSHPPGLYWYHAHPHGHSEEQVLGGASGAIIIEGIEASENRVRGLPERLLIFRDQTRQNPVSAIDPEPPSKDLSVNFVPVLYPEYPQAVLKVKPSQREFWRVLNASADTLMELHLLANGHLQSMGLVSMDGFPVTYGERGMGKTNKSIRWVQNIPLPPGGRAEFLFDAPSHGSVELITAGIQTVPFVDEDDPNYVPPPNGAPPVDNDDNTPPRSLMNVMVSGDAIEPAPLPETATLQSPSVPIQSLLAVHPDKTRRFYFSERILDAKNPQTSTEFYLTEVGHHPSVFKPGEPPNITVRQGSVEDWIIENRSQEVHTFHIHQTHFMVLARDSQPVHEHDLLDTVGLRYWEGGKARYPSVKMRIDFRDPGLVGVFPYHCHILQHEDGGMMGTVRVTKSAKSD